MRLSKTQKKWATGGGITALAIAVGYGLFHRKAEHAPQQFLPRDFEHPRREKARRRHSHGHSHGHGEHQRGEYGHRKMHSHG